MSQLALLGGNKVIDQPNPTMFAWPIVNPEMEQAVVDVLRRGAMSGNDITKQFEQGFAAWHQVPYALGHPNGTAALEAAMYAVGIGRGDEVIAPSLTYWATCTQVLGLGGKIVFADIDPQTLCIDPDDIEHRITPRTKAIIVVHYLAVPADMDRILAIARKHNLKVIEDASHSHGSLYKGQLTGTFGDVAGFSLMSGKGFAIGEAGILITGDLEIHEKAILYGHYERHNALTIDRLKAVRGLPLGGVKNRMHQMSAAVGLVQLKKFPAEMAEIDRAMKYFWSLLKDVPGIRPHMADESIGCTTGAWYAPHGHYDPAQFDGLSVARFCAAITAEGCLCAPGANPALHTHPAFSQVDIFHEGHPTNQLSGGRNVARDPLPITAGIQQRVFGVPWFKHMEPKVIDRYAEAVRKVAQHHQELLADDQPAQTAAEKWGLSVIQA